MFDASPITSVFPRLLAAAAAALVVLAAGGCVRVSHSSVASVGGEERGAQLDRAPNPDRVAALTDELAALGPDVSREEAAQVAALAVHYSEQLADWYGMVRPVELHNVMVNLKLRRGGLCYQMAECMLAELRELPLRTLEFNRAIAWQDDLWNEHNTVVVTAAGQPFETGVVLDAWRNGGRLRWAPVRLDHYPWRPKALPPRHTAFVARRPPMDWSPAAAQNVPPDDSDTEEAADDASAAVVAGFAETSDAPDDAPALAPAPPATADASATPETSGNSVEDAPPAPSENH